MEIKFINHASLQLQTDSAFLLTDPWYVSPAFGGWTQNPPPRVDDIKQLLSLPQDQLKVIISHGHDDHLDEFFIQKHLRNATFFVPKFKVNGLAKRIERLTGKYPVELTEVPYKEGDIELQSFINPDFTQYDAIIAIKTKDSVVIHANDNWHAYPETLINEIQQTMVGIEKNNRYFFIQFGIADCFPLNYPSFDQKEAETIIINRFESYYAATTKNLESLGFTRGFYYANQSIYPYPATWTGPSLYILAQEFLKNKQGPFVQCTAGLNIKNNLAPQSPATNLFEFQLQQLENFINSKLIGFTQVQLLTNARNRKPGVVGYEAPAHVWARVFNAELTLEAIIIGGMGLIHRPDQNISAIHHKVSKLSYFIQEKISSNGLHFLLEQT